MIPSYCRYSNTRIKRIESTMKKMQRCPKILWDSFVMLEQFAHFTVDLFYYIALSRRAEVLTSSRWRYSRLWLQFVTFNQSLSMIFLLFSLSTQLLKEQKNKTVRYKTTHSKYELFASGWDHTFSFHLIASV